jgi:hypothetical protein
MTKPFSPNYPSTPGVPMLYQPAKLDRTFSTELASRLCQEYTEECVLRLAEHMRDDINPQVSLAATKELLDRAYGKPKENKSLAGTNVSGAQFNIKVEFIDVIDNDAARRMRESDDKTIEIPTPRFEE